MLNLIFPFLLVSFASADYHISFVVQSIEFQAPNNTLADGSCCDSSCGECCDNGCSPSMRLCFREPQHPTDDPSCPLLEVVRNKAQAGLVVRGTDNTPIDKYYTGGFQLYIRIAHTVGDAADFDPPFDDPLIDEVFQEFTVAPVLFSERLSTSLIPQVLSTNGVFGRVEVAVVTFTHCADGWNGSACEIQCVSNICTQALTEPPTITTIPESTTTSESTTISLPQSPPTDGVISTEGSNVVAIAVGVSVGVVVLIAFVLVMILVVAAIKKKLTWNQSFNPSTVSYTLKAKRNIKGVQVSQGGNGGQAVNGNNEEPVSHYSGEPHTGQAVAATAPVYAAVNMERKGKKLMEESGEYSEPPSVPPYTPSDMDSYAPMKEQNGVVYENLNKRTKEY